MNNTAWVYVNVCGKYFKILFKSIKLLYLPNGAIEKEVKITRGKI